VPSELLSLNQPEVDFDDICDLPLAQLSNSVSMGGKLGLSERDFSHSDTFWLARGHARAIPHLMDWKVSRLVFGRTPGPLKRFTATDSANRSRQKAIPHVNQWRIWPAKRKHEKCRKQLIP
jgi:hypothetical protein